MGADGDGDAEERLFEGREMLMAHDLYRREFGLMSGVIRGVAVGDHERTEIIADHIDMITASLHLHHGIEDAQVWPALLRRDSDDIPVSSSRCRVSTPGLRSWRPKSMRPSPSGAAPPPLIPETPSPMRWTVSFGCFVTTCAWKNSGRCRSWRSTSPPENGAGCSTRRSAARTRTASFWTSA
jgi:hypothetical protein